MDHFSHQIRAARALLGWNAAALAKAAGVSPSTVQRVETGANSIELVRRALVAALDGAGIELVDKGARFK